MAKATGTPFWVMKNGRLVNLNPDAKGSRKARPAPAKARKRRKHGRRVKRRPGAGRRGPKPEDGGRRAEDGRGRDDRDTVHEARATGSWAAGGRRQRAKVNKVKGRPSIRTTRDAQRCGRRVRPEAFAGHAPPATGSWAAGEKVKGKREKANQPEAGRTTQGTLRTTTKHRFGTRAGGAT